MSSSQTPVHLPVAIGPATGSPHDAGSLCASQPELHAKVKSHDTWPERPCISGGEKGKNTSHVCGLNPDTASAVWDVARSRQHCHAAMVGVLIPAVFVGTRPWITLQAPLSSPTCSLTGMDL